VLCVVLNVVEFGMAGQEAVEAPRLHHQWFPDRIQAEGDPKGLAERGHVVQKVGKQGDAHTVWLNPKTGRYEAARDLRRAGRPAGFGK
ncbi:MAG: gamma-glutamyltransferase, partial [Gemmataceae bacterium]|nr:gamma-glutamyltransferase [Gemmataceae bacterium]